MTTRNRSKVLEIILAVSVLFAVPHGASGQGSQDLTNLVAQVDPAVVTITLDDHSQGSGFVIDPKGVIVTNYHVIEGAKTATVVFPDKSSFRAEGFLAIAPGKDLALLQIRPDKKELRALRVAEDPPSKGEKVFAFGSPLGMSGSVSDGIIAALRPGEEVREILRSHARIDVYKDLMGYDLDDQWLQTTAPVSPGNSGGPLVNARGEVVGINTWVQSIGQNLNFSLSAKHVTQLVAAASASPQPFANLPPVRKQRPKADVEKTLAIWKQLNELKGKLAQETAASEKRMQQVPPPNPRNPMQGLNLRLKKYAVIYDKLSRIHGDYAGKVKALEIEQADPNVMVLAIAESDLAQRINDLCQKIAEKLNGLNDVIDEADIHWQIYKKVAANLNTSREIIRVEMSRRYEKHFPTIEETAAGSSATTSGTKGGESGKAVSARSEEESPFKPAAPKIRTWTDRSGKFKIEAKFGNLKDGIVTLEKSDGKPITVPLEKLSEADQRYVEKQK